MNNGSDFSSVKVGDRLWCRLDWYEGYGVFVNIEPKNSYPVIVRVSDVLKGFTLDGRVYISGPQCLFWDKVGIDPPSRPKKMVKRRMEGYFNVYRNGTLGSLYPTEEEAIRHRQENAVGEPIYIIHEWEEAE